MSCKLCSCNNQKGADGPQPFVAHRLCFMNLSAPLRLDRDSKNYKRRDPTIFLELPWRIYFTVFIVPAESKSLLKHGLRVSKGYKMAINGDLADELHDSFDTILTLDFGSQYSHLITRWLRELNVYRDVPTDTESSRSIVETQRHHLSRRVVLIISGWRKINVDPAVFELGVSSLAYVTVYKKL